MTPASCARCGAPLPPHPGPGKKFTFCPTCAAGRKGERNRLQRGPREAWIRGGAAPAPPSRTAETPRPRRAAGKAAARSPFPVGTLNPFDGLRLASGACPDCGGRALRRGPWEGGAQNVRCECGAGFLVVGDALGLGAVRLAGPPPIGGRERSDGGK